VNFLLNECFCECYFIFFTKKKNQFRSSDDGIEDAEAAGSNSVSLSLSQSLTLFIFKSIANA
jgi:hypothetical protein